MELIETLGLDWKLLLAQIVNFFILLWILKRFAYKPILEALERRRDRIAQSERHADAIAKNLEQSKEEREKLLARARKEAQSIIAASEAQGKKLQEEMVASAKKDVEKIVADAHTEINRAREKMLADAREEVASMVVVASSKVLERQIDEKVNAALIASALEKLTTAKK